MRPLYFTYILAFFLTLSGLAFASETDVVKDKMEAFHTSGLPLPRFVSLEDAKTHVRAGPGEKYPIRWVIERQGLPVEIILEFENWRKIRDFEGQEGWVFQGLLSGKRTGIVKSKAPVPAYQGADAASEKAMMLEPMVLLDISACEGEWCAVSSAGFSGWLQRKYIWGVYANENFD